VITQRELAELEMLRQKMKHAVKQYQRRREMIRRRLEAGASIEAGLRGADLRPHTILHLY
jgi:hypothetical protein